jgi:2-polyprenyl-6-methoxyphenol hydroxylase-like FAD-dependent oxidoreductase
MSNKKNTYRVAIVGGGPVGLFLACCLTHAGISCIVLEKRSGPVTHSRSIGIHPVSLEKFQEVGLAEAFTAEGIKVTEGLAFCNSKKIGALSFASCPPPYPYILTLPQHKTERILAAHLNALDSDILRRGAKVTGMSGMKRGICIQTDKNGEHQEINAEYVAGCDGKDSFVRQWAAVPFRGKKYGDTYIMGDFSDNTKLEHRAAIYICDEGLIESFPLSDGMRRWVVKTDRYYSSVERDELEKCIADRINHDLSRSRNTMLSSFGVEKKFAETMAGQRFALAGDSGHLISPIGGQGMNLGWLDAADLCNCFKQLFSDVSSKNQILAAYSKRRLKIARKAARRAEFNMAMGRTSGSMIFKKGLLYSLINSPVSGFTARLFTMRNLSKGFL